MSVTLESAIFMGKNYLDNCHSITNTEDLTLKQMFDISARLVSEQDEISVMETIGWENHSWKYMSLIGDERDINLQRTKVYVFSDSVLCLGKIFENPPIERCRGRKIGMSPFPGFNTLQLSEEVKSLLLRLGETPENFTGRIIFMSMFNDISCGSRDNEKECESNANLVSLYSEKKWNSISEDSPQRRMGQYGGKDDVGIRRKRTSNFPCYKSIVQRSTQKQSPWKIVGTLLCHPRND